MKCFEFRLGATNRVLIWYQQKGHFNWSFLSGHWTRRRFQWNVSLHEKRRSEVKMVFWNYLHASFLIINRTEVSNANICATSKSLLSPATHSRGFRTRRLQANVRHHLQVRWMDQLRLDRRLVYHLGTLRPPPKVVSRSVCHLKQRVRHGWDTKRQLDSDNSDN